jgi:hypothetical protein
VKIFWLLLFLWLPLNSSAQNASLATAPDLLIIDYKLGPFLRIDVSSPEPPQVGTPADPLTKAQSSVTVKFSKPMRADHLGTWRQRQKEGSMSVRASIIRVEYDDGSLWERGPLRLQFRD